MLDISDFWHRDFIFIDIYKTTMKYKSHTISYENKKFKLKEAFKISRGSKSSIKTLKIKVEKNNIFGHGECVPYTRYGDKLEKITKILKSNKNINNLNEIKFLSLRNAISNAYYDLKLKEKKIPFKKIVKYTKFKTAITIPIVNEKKFKKQVIKYKNVKYLKIKLNEKNIFNYLDIVKKHSTKSKIIIDANEGWSLSFLRVNEKKLKQYNILFIEQPLKSNKDHLLKSNLPLCADESFHLNKNNKNIKKIYKWVNIKPDKFGTEKDIMKAIKYARKNKLKIFLGCMVSSSLSIIPSLRFAKYCNLLDLDGAMFLSQDYKFGLKYKKDNLIYNKSFNFGHN